MRAAWTVHAAVGFVVIPAKSQATAAWERSNCDRVTDVRVGGVDPGVLEALPDGGGVVGVAEPDELAVDVPVAQVGLSRAMRTADRRTPAAMAGRVAGDGRVGRCLGGASEAACRGDQPPLPGGHGGAAVMEPSRLRSGSVSGRGASRL